MEKLEQIKFNNRNAATVDLRGGGGGREKLNDHLAAGVN
jgi:hypothetical protein